MRLPTLYSSRIEKADISCHKRITVMKGSVNVMSQRQVRAGCRDMWNAFMVEEASFTSNDIPICPCTAKNSPTKLISYEQARLIYKEYRKKGFTDLFINAFVRSKRRQKSSPSSTGSMRSAMTSRRGCPPRSPPAKRSTNTIATSSSPSHARTHKKEAPASLRALPSVTDNYLAGVRVSCISRVSPVIPSACGSDEICHLK